MFVIKISAKVVLNKKNIKNRRINEIDVEKIFTNYFVNSSNLSNKYEYSKKIKLQLEKQGILYLINSSQLDYIVGYENIDGIQCYFIKNDEVQYKDKFTIEVMIIVGKDELDNAINIVYNRLNKMFFKFRVKFDINKKAKIYLPQYLINSKSEEEINSKPYIEVDLGRIVFWQNYFVGKCVTMILILVITIIIVLKNNKTNSIVNIGYSIIASVIFTIILDLILRIIEIKKQKYFIDIGNMSTFLYEQAINDNIRPEILPQKGEEDSLEDPQEEE